MPIRPAWTDTSSYISLTGSCATGDLATDPAPMESSRLCCGWSRSHRIARPREMNRENKCRDRTSVINYPRCFLFCVLWAPPAWRSALAAAPVVVEGSSGGSRDHCPPPGSHLPSASRERAVIISDGVWWASPPSACAPLLGRCGSATNTPLSQQSKGWANLASGVFQLPSAESSAVWNTGPNAS